MDLTSLKLSARLLTVLYDGLRPTPDDNAGSAGWLAGVRRGLTSTTAVLVIGVLVFGLADLLDALFEAGISR